MPAVVFQGSKVKTLKDTLNLNGGSDIITSTTDPTTSAVSAEPGSLLLNKTTGFVYRKLDSGSSTNWTLVGSEAGGAKSYATGNNSTADSALGSGWSTFDDGAYPPVDGGGGTVTATLARTTSSPLQGAGSMLFTPGGQYDAAAFGFTIDRADFARMHKIEFDYEIGTVASYTDGDLKLAVVCASDSGFTTDLQVIQPAGHSISKVSGQETHVATFQSHASNLYYRVCLVQTTASTGYTVKFDNFKVGPQSVAYGAPVTDWVSYTPTGSWVSNTNYSGKWRRVGDTAEYSVEVDLTGAPTAASLSINLASGQTIDTTKMVNSNDSQNILGIATVLDSGTQNYRISEVRYNNTTSVDVWGPANSTAPTDSSNINSTTPFTFASGDRVWVQFSVPILGWSSNVVVSSEADTRVVGLSIPTGTGNHTSTGNTQDITTWGTALEDTHNAFNSVTGVYTVPVPGRYDISAVLAFAANSTGHRYLEIQINGSTSYPLGYMPANAVATNTISGTRSLRLKAGDTIKLRAYQNSGGNLAYSGDGSLSISMRSGPAQIAASESVSASINNSTTSLTSATDTKVVFSAKDYDSHGAINGSYDTFTAPISGTYSIKAFILGPSVAHVVGSDFNIFLYKNGSSYRRISMTISAAASTYRMSASGSIEVRLLAGETLQIWVNTLEGGSIPAGASAAWATFNRVGNY